MKEKKCEANIVACQHLINHGGTIVLPVLICVRFCVHSLEMSILHVLNTVFKTSGSASYQHESAICISVSCSIMSSSLQPHGL